VGVFLAVILTALPALAVTKIPTLEVTGQLEEIDDSQEPAVIVLNVKGTKASGLLSENCRFADAKGSFMEQVAFVKRYTKKMVTLELVAESGTVIACWAE
jgi:hypothetical protein